MGLLKNICVGFSDGCGTGAYWPGYAAKKISGRDFFSHGEEIDAGRLTDEDVNRNSLEYQTMKGIGDVVGVVFGASTLYLIGIIYDIKRNRNLQKVKA